MLRHLHTSQSFEGGSHSTAAQRGDGSEGFRVGRSVDSVWSRRPVPEWRLLLQPRPFGPLHLCSSGRLVLLLEGHGLPPLEARPMHWRARRAGREGTGNRLCCSVAPEASAATVTAATIPISPTTMSAQPKGTCAATRRTRCTPSPLATHAPALAYLPIL